MSIIENDDLICKICEFLSKKEAYQLFLIKKFRTKTLFTLIFKPVLLYYKDLKRRCEHCNKLKISIWKPQDYYLCYSCYLKLPMCESEICKKRKGRFTKSCHWSCVLPEMIVWSRI